MRSTPMVALLAAAISAIGLPGGTLASHTVTTTVPYLIAGGVVVAHGVGDVQDEGGFVYCTDDVAALGLGCMGGSGAHSHPLDADCGNPDACHIYQKASATGTDALSGPNVMIKLCLWNPEGGPACDDGQFDGIPDAHARGCGIPVPVDATGIHDGDHHAAFFVRNLAVDPATNEVCLGSTGEISVVFTP